MWLFFALSALAVPDPEGMIDVILARDLFNLGAWRCTYPGDTARLNAPIELLGTFVTVPAEYSSALVQVEGEVLPIGVSVGDKLLDRLVTAIDRDRLALLGEDGVLWISMRVL